MVTCKNCSSTNSLDSAFCKKCGATLPEDELNAAKEKLEQVVADGLKIFAAGRLDEATQIAEQAVSVNPHSKAALSLKAMCHERRGEIGDAIDCYERVLVIDPDSMIDRIKVKDLQNLLVTRSSAAAVPDRKLAIAAAAAAFVLVASIGVLAARTVNREDGGPVAMNQPRASGTNPGSGGSILPDTTSAGVTQNQNATGSDSTGQTPPDRPQTQTVPDQRQETSNVPPVDRGPQVNLPRSPEGTLPKANEDNAGIGPIIFKPEELPKEIVKKDGRTGNTGLPNVPSKNPPTDPPPTPDRQSETAPPPQRESPGIMDIKVVSRGSNPTSTSSGSVGANGVEALVRTARQQYQLGNWASAATSFERALRAGADPGSNNQRLAQCYEKLGRNSDAVGAYNRAIEAYQSDVNSGSGDKSRLQAALDSCRQAVKVLGG